MEEGKERSELTMDHELSRFLMNKNIFTTGHNFTHSSQIFPMGKYLLSGKELDKFYDIYCRRLDELGDKFIAGIAERPQKYMPILVDVDIKMSLDLSYDDSDEKQAIRHLYKQKHIDQIIEIYVSTISFLLQHSDDPLDPRHLICFVLEKSKPYIDEEKNTIKSGFHLHFPYVYFSRDDQEVNLEPRIKEQINRANIFADIGVLNSAEVIDCGMYNKPWLMYGSRKDPKKEAYKLTRIVGYNNRSLSLDEVLEEFPLINTDCQEIALDPDVLCEYYLPLILSTHSFGKKIYKTCLPKSTPCLLRSKLDQVKNMTIQHEKTNMPETIQLCRDLVPMLSSERATKYQSWLNVGMCLWTLTKGCVEGYDLFVAFSETTEEDNFDPTSCMAFWKKYSASFDWTLGHLRSWAKTDSPQKYEAYRNDLQAKRVQDSLNGGQTDLAKYLYDKYGHEFVCADITHNKWYQFRKHRWVETQNGNNLYKLIDMDIVARFLKEQNKCRGVQTVVTDKDIQHYESLSIEDDDEYKPVPSANAEEQDRLKHRGETLNKIVAKLKDVGFKDKIIRECRSLFYQEDFLEKLDSNQSLVCFTNGVLDLTSNTFRAGRPEDYCSYSTKYDYKEFDSWDDPAVIEIITFFNKVFVDPVIRNFFLDYIGTLLKGGQDQLFSIWSGIGANAKSSLIDLLHKTLGDYCTTLRTTCLTGKSADGGAATPELMKCRNRKLVYTTEPDQNSEFNCDFIKKLTGDGVIDARGLFKDNVDLVITFKLILLCNNLPKLPPNDDGMWRRILRVPFLSRFPRDDKEVPESYSEQVRMKIFKRDPHLIQKLPEMRQAMMWVMFQKYKEVQTKNNNTYPEIITNSIEEYRLQNDEYLMYIKERLVADPSGSVTFDEFAQGFMNFCKENFDKCKYKRPDIKTELFRRWGQPQGRLRWYGFRARTVQDDIADGTVIEDNTTA